jgi:hypothetical protein
LQDQVTVSSSVLPSCAQQHPSRRRHHRRTPHTFSSPSRRRRRPCRSWGNFGFKCFWAKCWLRHLRLRRRCGGVHVRALMKGVGSVKWYGMEGRERRQRGDAGFSNKANLPHRGERAAPLPRPRPPPGQRKKGGKERGGGGGTRKEGRGRVGSEGARKRDNN